MKSSVSVTPGVAGFPTSRVTLVSPIESGAYSSQPPVARDRRRRLRLPELQPDLPRRAADDEEDRAEAAADRAHGGAEEVRRAPRRLRPEGAAQRDGPHGDRSGDDHPHHDGRQLPL